MATIQREISIAQPARQLFSLLQDYSLRARWDPIHDEFEFLDPGKPGVGTRLWYRAKHGCAMTVRYIAYQPPLRVAMRMVRGPWYFSRFAGSWIFSQAGDGSTRVRFRYHLRLRRGLRVVERVVAFYAGWMSERRLLALKRFAEGPEWRARSAFNSSPPFSRRSPAA